MAAAAASWNLENYNLLMRSSQSANRSLAGVPLEITKPKPNHLWQLFTRYEEFLSVGNSGNTITVYEDGSRLVQAASAWRRGNISARADSGSHWPTSLGPGPTRWPKTIGPQRLATKP